MKQTNNAIKFLMAQYRAVFKHAYLASLGASLVAATALLSAPAASAAPMTNTEFDAYTNPTLQIGGDGAPHETLTISGGLANSAAKQLSITFKAGESTIKAKPAGQAPDTDPAINDIDLSATSITIHEADSKNAAKLTVGDGTTQLNLKLKEVTVTKGTLEISSAADNATTVETSTISIGVASDAKPPVTQDAVVNIGAGGVLGKTGAEITVNTTGKVTASGENAKLVGNVSISGGTVAADESMTIEGDLTATAGALTTTATKTATVTGNATFTGKDSLSNAGNLVIQGDAVFADKSVKESSGTVTFTKTASMNGDTLKKLMTGDVKSADNANAVITVGDSGSVGLDSKGLTLINESGDGAINAKLKNGADGTLTVHVAEGTLASNAISGDSTTQSGVVLSFDSLTLGDGKADVTAKAANLKVSKALTVSGDHALVLSDASTLTLKAADPGLKTIGGKGVTLGVAADPSGTPAASAGTLDVNGGNWSVKNLNIVSGAATVTNSTLTVTGTLTTTAGAADKDPANGKLTANASTIDVLGSGDLAIKKGGVTLENTAELHVDAKDIFQEGKKTLDNTKVASGSLVGGSNTVLVIKDENGKDLSLTQAEFKALKAANTEFNGLYKVNISDLEAPTGPVELGDVEGNNTSDVYEKTTVTVADGSTTSVDKVISVGNIQVKNNSDLSLGTGGAVTLNTPSADGFFVSKSGASGTEVANVTFNEADNALTLYGSGQIGAIVNGGSATGGSLTVGSENKKGDVVVKGSIGAKELNKDVQSVIVNKGSKLKVEGDLYTKSLDLAKGTSLNANNGEGAVVINGEGSIFGNVTAGSLEFAKAGTDTDKIKNTIAGDVEVNVGSLSIAGNNVLTIGQDGNAETSTTATVFTDTLEMASGSTIFVDPSYKKAATVLGIKTLTDGTTGDGVNVAAGNIIVGQNAAFGLGFDKAEFNSVMANYLVDGKFTDPAEHKGGYANALVLGDSLVIAKGNGVSVDHNLTDEKVAEGTAATPDNVKLGANAALIITDKAFGADKQGAAITFGKTSENVSDAKVVSDDLSVISLVGDFDANDTNLKIFAASNGGTGANDVAIQNTNGIKVKALGGLLEGKLKGTSGTLDKLKLSKDADKKAYDGVARPVGDFFLGLANGNYAVDSTQAGHKFVTSVANTAGGFKVVDTAAHAATYAGAQQAAVASVTTMADAMFGRVGAVGVEAASISATGSQANGGVWLTPMYKSLDSDGFNAEGASYGSEVDLGGVAFGADTVNGNMRFGAVFNIGSGDADGKGQGNGLKDEFDYYGFGIYSAMGFGSFALVGDASMTVISHEVEGLGLRGKADTTAVTMGLTGQYTVATPAVDVTPHLGARFIRLNTDSYDLIGANGAIATTDFDVQNVFSVPLGVTLSKAFVTGGWSLAPSADLTVAFNTGDTEAKSTTTFSGIGHGINLNTEVLDEVQYGVTLGLGAQYGAFGTSLNVNYTGSSNTDSFGVNAQCRYMF